VENVTRWQHARLLTMMILFFAVDLSLVYTSALHVMTEGKCSVVLIFPVVGPTFAQTDFVCSQVDL
jgi:hypothetical protein